VFCCFATCGQCASVELARPSATIGFPNATARTSTGVGLFFRSWRDSIQKEACEFVIYLAPPRPTVVSFGLRGDSNCEKLVFLIFVLSPANPRLSKEHLPRLWYRKPCVKTCRTKSKTLSDPQPAKIPPVSLSAVPKLASQNENFSVCVRASGLGIGFWLRGVQPRTTMR
jgi:hypothetical protein